MTLFAGYLIFVNAAVALAFGHNGFRGSLNCRSTVKWGNFGPPFFFIEELKKNLNREKVELYCKFGAYEREEEMHLQKSKIHRIDFVF